jgi:hypothetical protein
VDAASADHPRVGVCDPVAQDCPAQGRCTINHASPPALFCDSDPGAADAGAVCAFTQQSDTCERGTVCLETGDTPTCRHFCFSDGDCAGDYCATPILGTSLFACAPRCHVLAQDCAVLGEACYLGQNPTSGATTQQCSGAGSTPDGDPCAVANDCVPGSLCVQPQDADAGGFACRKACDTTAAACPTGTHCVAYLGQDNLGYCLSN